MSANSNVYLCVHQHMLQETIDSAGLTIKFSFEKKTLCDAENIQSTLICVHLIVDLLWSFTVKTLCIVYFWVVSQIIQMIQVGGSVYACTVSSNYNIGGLKSDSFPDEKLSSTDQKHFVKSNFASAMEWNEMNSFDYFSCKQPNWICWFHCKSANRLRGCYFSQLNYFYRSDVKHICLTSRHFMLQSYISTGIFTTTKIRIKRRRRSV